MSADSFGLAVATAPLEPWPLEPDQIVSGSPVVSGAVIDTSPDGRVVRGIWKHTVGTSRDIEADEMFVVVEGRATVEIAGAAPLDVGPGDVAVLRAGDRTVWTVHEDLVKVFQTTGSGG